MSTEKLHLEFTVDDGIHIAHSWSLAWETDLSGLSVTSSDVGRIAHCENEGFPQFFILARVSPDGEGGTNAEWLPITQFASVTEDPNTPRHVYLAATGDDANDGLGPLTARRTVAAAWALLPATLYAPFTLHLGSGSYDWVAPPDSLEQVGARACITVVGDGAGQPADDGCAVASSGTIAASSTAMAVNVSEVLTANARRGYTFESGGARRHVTANTANQVSLSEGLPAFTTGTPYRLTRPGVLLDMKGPTITARQPFARCDLINIVNVRIRGGNAEILACEHVSLFGVEIESQLFCGEHVLAGATAQFPFFKNRRIGNSVDYFAAWMAAANLTATHVQWNGWGLCATSATPVGAQYNGLGIANGGRFEGYLTIPMCQLGLGAADVAVLLAGGAVANLITSGMRQKYFILGAFTIGQGGALDANTVLTLQYDAVLTTQAVLTIQSAHGSHMAIVQNSAKMVCMATLALIYGANTATSAIVVQHDGSLSAAAVTLACGGSPRQFLFADNALVSMTSFIGYRGGGGYSASIVQGSARFIVGALETMQLSILDEALLQAASIYIPTVDGVLVSGPGAMLSVSGAVYIQNTSPSARYSALTITAGAKVYMALNPTITIAGATGYAVSCRGGGTFLCGAAPVGAVGKTSDFTVGSAAGEDFDDAVLAASLSFKSAGPSMIARTS
jgi:hypothetical protein